MKARIVVLGALAWFVSALAARGEYFGHLAKDSPIPEPSSLPLLLLTYAAVLAQRRRC